MGEQRKISELTEVTTLSGDDELVFVKYGDGNPGPEPTPTPYEKMYYDTYPDLLGDIVVSNHEIDSYNGTYTQVRPTPGVFPGSGDPLAFDGDVDSWTPYAGDGHKYPVWVQTNPSDFNKYISFCYTWAGDTKRWVISSSIGARAFAGPGDNRINTYVGTNPADSDLGGDTPPNFGGIPWECTSWKKLTDGTASSLTMSNPFATPTPTCQGPTGSIEDVTVCLTGFNIAQYNTTWSWSHTINGRPSFTNSTGDKLYWYNGNPSHWTIAMANNTNYRSASSDQPFGNESYPWCANWTNHGATVEIC